MHEARLRWEEMGARRYQEARARTLPSLYADWVGLGSRSGGRSHAPPVGALCGLDPCTGPGGGACGWAGPRLPMAEVAVGDYAMMQGAFMHVHPAGRAFAASA